MREASRSRHPGPADRWQEQPEQGTIDRTRSPPDNVVSSFPESADDGHTGATSRIEHAAAIRYVGQQLFEEGDITSVTRACVKVGRSDAVVATLDDVPLTPEHVSQSSRQSRHGGKPHD
jgi:hypothetical protein